MNFKNYTKEDYKKAFTELCFFLDEFDDKELEKIPKKELDYYYNNRDTTYKFECDIEEPFDNIEMMHLTEILLANIYEKYLSNDEEKQKLQKRRTEYYRKSELEKSQKYDTNLFKESPKNIKPENTQIIVKKEGIIKRIITKLKSLFKRKQNWHKTEKMI